MIIHKESKYHCSQVSYAVERPRGSIAAIEQKLENHTVRLSGHQSAPQIVNFELLHENRFLYLDVDKTLRIWNLDGEKLAVMKGQTAPPF